MLHFTLLESSFVSGGENCYDGGYINFAESGPSSIYIPYLLDGCGASVELETVVPDVEAFAGSNFVFNSYVSEYFAVAEDDEFITVPRWMYGPTDVCPVNMMQNRLL